MDNPKSSAVPLLTMADKSRGTGPPQVPVKARDLSVVGGIAIDTSLQLGMSKSPDLKSESMDELVEKFRQIAREENKVISDQ